MTAPATVCVSSAGQPKKSYPSAAAAHRDLAHSPRWRRRATWPVTFWCSCCRAYHLAHAETDK